MKDLETELHDQLCHAKWNVEYQNCIFHGSKSEEKCQHFFIQINTNLENERS